MSLYEIFWNLYIPVLPTTSPFVHNIITWEVIPTLFVYLQICKRCFLTPPLWSFNQWWNFSTHNLFPQKRIQFKFHHVTYSLCIFTLMLPKTQILLDLKNVALLLWVVNPHRSFSSLSQKLWLLNYNFFTCFKSVFESSHLSLINIKSSHLLSIFFYRYLSFQQT